MKKVLLGLAAVIVVLLIAIATRPATFRVERSLSMAAPPPVPLALIGDFQRWPEWSPWEELDPAMQRKHEGTPGAVGSTYWWSGNDKVGEGRMTLTDVKPDKVTIKLEFLKPWEATSTTEFALTPGAGGTTVAWVMNGNNDFVGKAFSLVMDMDSMIGADFEKGLGKMKTAAEAAAKAVANAEAAAAKAAAEAAAKATAEAAAAAAAAAAGGAPADGAAAAPAPQ